MVKIVCISDTHNMQNKGTLKNLPYGDILIHAGDSTSMGYEHEVQAFGAWIRKQPHMYKIVISGNHDFMFQDSPKKAQELFYGTSTPDHSDGVYYLEDSFVDINVDGKLLRIYGSPWQPRFYNWAFNADPDELKEKWNLIPPNVDILVTHGPPYGLQDAVKRGGHVGCPHLREAIRRVAPKLHVCGHIHESYGINYLEKTTIANAASCGLGYFPNNPPLVFELQDDGTLQEASKIQGQTLPVE